MVEATRALGRKSLRCSMCRREKSAQEISAKVSPRSDDESDVADIIIPDVPSTFDAFSDKVLLLVVNKKPFKPIIFYVVPKFIDKDSNCCPLAEQQQSYRLLYLSSYPAHFHLPKRYTTLSFNERRNSN